MALTITAIRGARIPGGHILYQCCDGIPRRQRGTLPHLITTHGLTVAEAETLLEDARAQVTSRPKEYCREKRRNCCSFCGVLLTQQEELAVRQCHRCLTEPDWRTRLF